MNYLEVKKDSGQLEISVTIGDLPNTVTDAGQELFVIQEAAKRLEARRKILSKLLESKMSGGLKKKQEVILGGVRMIMYEKPYTKWKDAFDAVVSELIPKTRFDDAMIIANGLTHSGFESRFSPADAPIEETPNEL